MTGPSIASVGDTSEHWVVIPRQPGPIRTLSSTSDEDDFIDPIDEPAAAEDQPGRADVVLIGAGLLLIGLGWFLPIGVLGTLGWIALVLGIALPLQAGVRAVRGRRRVSKARRMLATGYPLDLSTRESRALVNAYERVLAITDGTATERPRNVPPDRAADARAAAHRALVEAASLLDGRAASVAAERTYLRKRTDAMNALAGALTASSQAAADAEVADAEADRDERDERAAAVALAREELDQETGLGSLAQMAQVAERIRRSRRDDDAG